MQWVHGSRAKRHRKGLCSYRTSGRLCGDDAVKRSAKLAGTNRMGFCAKHLEELGITVGRVRT